MLSSDTVKRQQAQDASDDFRGFLEFRGDGGFGGRTSVRGWGFQRRGGLRGKGLGCGALGGGGCPGVRIRDGGKSDYISCFGCHAGWRRTHGWEGIYGIARLLTVGLENLGL